MKKLKSSIYDSTKTIMIYKAIGGEVDLKEIEISEINVEKQLVYPYCVDKSKMIALSQNRDGIWKCGMYGIEAPDLETSTEILPEEIELIICPITAFDESCNRVGMGVGYKVAY